MEPTPEALAELPPGKLIMVAVDTNEPCVAAFRYALDELYRPGDKIGVVHVAKVMSPDVTVLHIAPDSTFDMRPDSASLAQMEGKVENFIKARFLDVAAAKGATAYPRLFYAPATFGPNDVADAVLQACADDQAALLVVSWIPKANFLSSMIMGSVVKHIMAKASLPLLLVRDYVPKP